jgi:hypothetical protein
MKSMILMGLSCGLTYALLMGAWEYYDTEAITLWKVIANALFFGTCMAFVFRKKVTKIN